jgi:hypothetical protein
MKQLRAPLQDTAKRAKDGFQKQTAKETGTQLYQQ